MYFIKCRNGSKGIYIKMDFIFDGEFEYWFGILLRDGNKWRN